MLISSDGGESFRWVCKEQVGYNNEYVPDYAVAADGTVYATTFDGLRYTRDFCTWSLVDGVPGDAFLPEVEIGGDGVVWTITAGAEDDKNVFASEDGVSFSGRGLPLAEGWFLSLKVSPNDPARVYVTRFIPSQTGSALHRTDDGGDGWTELPLDGVEPGPAGILRVIAVLPGSPEVVYLLAPNAAADGNGDVLYRSTDLGQSWDVALTTPYPLRALVGRQDGTTVLASSVNDCPVDPDMGPIDQDSRGYVSTDRGASFESLPGEHPSMCCLAERGDGVLFSCGENGEPDFFALARAAEPGDWSEVHRFEEIAGPLDCSATDSQDAEEIYSMCLAVTWPQLCCDLGACPDEQCQGGTVDAGTGDDDGGSSCLGCRAQGAGAGLWLLPLLLLLRSRPRARRG